MPVFYCSSNSSSNYSKSSSKIQTNIMEMTKRGSNHQVLCHSKLVSVLPYLFVFRFQNIMKYVFDEKSFVVESRSM